MEPRASRMLGPHTMCQLPTLPETQAERLNSTLPRLLALPEGERRIGPFVLLRQLGRGGFAPVRLAREEYGSMDLRSVALKVFALDRGEPGSLIGRPTTVHLARGPRALPIKPRVSPRAIE